MTLEAFQIKLIKLYMDQELLMASLYAAMARSFPTYAQQFTALVSEEHEHAGWIRHLEQCIMNGTASFSEGKTRTYTITTLMNYMQSILTQVENGSIDLLKAISLASDAEKSFIERNIFERFDGDSDEIERILRILDTAQREHLNGIEQLAAQIRQDLAGSA